MGTRADTRGKAEEEIARRSQKEAERVATRAKERLAEDEKTTRLRQLRLAKEAADRAEPAPRKAAAKARAP